jgi:transposase
MEKCMERKDPNKKKSERKVKFVHGLLKCKTCARLWNRDANASRNILRIARSALLNQERPFDLRRTHHSGVSDG